MSLLEKAEIEQKRDSVKAMAKADDDQRREQRRKQKEAERLVSALEKQIITERMRVQQQRLDAEAAAACCIADDLRGRPYFAASIDAYDIRSTDSLQTRQMWGTHFRGQSTFNELARIFNQRLERVAQTHGGTPGPFASSGEASRETDPPVL